MTSMKKTIFTAVCTALCVVLPLSFHSIPNGGPVFLPMHIPVLLCGLTYGWQYGLVCGVVGPAMSSLLTGMPPMPVLPAMMIECAAYGSITGLLMKYVHTGKLYPDLYISMIAAMAAGRILSGIAKALIFTPGLSLAAWATASFVTGLPGICVQLLLIPTVVYTLMKAHLIPPRYPKGEQSA